MSLITPSISFSGSTDKNSSNIDLQNRSEVPHQNSQFSLLLSTFRAQDTVSSLQIHQLKKEKDQQSKIKTKIIQKPPKQNQSEKRKGKEKKEPLKFYRIKRRIIPAKKNIAIFQEKVNFQMIDILDWQMEICANIYISKDAFYSAVSMSRQIFGRNWLNILSQKVITLQALGIISLAAKVDSSELNYTQILANMCCINKEDIIQSELCVLKKLQYRFHFRQVYAVICQMCEKWNRFIERRGTELAGYSEILKLGNFSERRSWGNQVQNKIEDIFYFFDAILIKCHDLFPLSNILELENAASIALFTVMNYLTKGFFPISLTDRSHLLMIFHAFLTLQYQNSRIDNQKWMNKLLTVQDKVKIVENSHLYFQDRNLMILKKQNSMAETSSSQLSLKTQSESPIPLYQQIYHPSIRKWK